VKYNLKECWNILVFTPDGSSVIECARLSGEISLLCEFGLSCLINVLKDLVLKKLLHFNPIRLQYFALE